MTILEVRYCDRLVSIKKLAIFFFISIQVSCASQSKTEQGTSAHRLVETVHESPQAVSEKIETSQSVAKSPLRSLKETFELLRPRLIHYYQKTSVTGKEDNLWLGYPHYKIGDHEYKPSVRLFAGSDGIVRQTALIFEVCNTHKSPLNEDIFTKQMQGFVREESAVLFSDALEITELHLKDFRQTGSKKFLPVKIKTVRKVRVARQLRKCDSRGGQAFRVDFFQ